MEFACPEQLRDAYARVGRKVVPAHVRERADMWAELDDRERAVVIADIDLVAAVLFPAVA